MPVHLYKYLVSPGALPEGYRSIPMPPGADVALEGAWLLPRLVPGTMFSNGAPCIMLFRDPACGLLQAHCSAPLLMERHWRATAPEAVVIRFTATGFARFLPGKYAELRHAGLLDLSFLLNGLPVNVSLIDAAKVLMESIGEGVDALEAPPARLLQAIAVVCDRQGDIRIGELSRLVSVNTKWLDRHFYTWVGVSPKEFARLQRFLHAYLHLENSAGGNVSDTAVFNGYYDRKHFLREFRMFMGCTPADHLLAEAAGNSSNLLPGRWLS